MKIHSKDQQAVISLLTEIYLEIAEIEERFRLIAGGGDVRPRIDFFHDAVRAFTASDGQHPRLAVEFLSYDLQCLRYIQSMPLAPFRDTGKNLSPSLEIINTDVDIATLGNHPDRKTRIRIADLYQHYSVMFSALLKHVADHDYQERIDTLNNDAHNIHSLISKFETRADVNILSQLAQQLDEGELRIILVTFLQQKKHLSNSDVKKLIGHLKNLIKQKDKSIKSLDKAHIQFAMAQLGIFEESKDMLKKLASQGMNLVGRFVEASVAETRKQMGR